MDKRESLFFKLSDNEKNAVLYDRTGNLTEKAFIERITSFPDSIISSFILKYPQGDFTDYINHTLSHHERRHIIQKEDKCFKIVIPHKERMVIEDRKGQNRMMADFEQTIDEREILIAEAPPGTGKSLAYLTPIVKKLKDKKRSIVSTNTKNLQMQLFEKDLEIASHNSDESFSAVMIKGIGNYLCFQKYSENIAKIDSLMKLAIDGFIQNSASGDLSELKFWHNLDYFDITSDSEYCTDEFCPFHNICYFIRIREKAKTAQIVFTNHYLMLIDASMKNKLLGEYDIAVFDEAHNLENVITDVYSYKFDFNYSLRIIGYFVRTFEKHLRLLRESTVSSDAISFFERMFVTLNEVKEGIEIIRLYLVDVAEMDGTEKESYSGKLFEPVKDRLKGLQGKMFAIVDEAERGRKILREEHFKITDVHQTMKYINEKMNLFFESFMVVADGNNDEYAFFFEYDSVKKNIVLNGLPVDTGAIFSKTVLYDENRSFLFTSATLQAADTFEMFKNQTGIMSVEKKYTENVYESSFDYKNQMKIFCVKGIGDPNSKDFMERASNTIDEIIKNDKRTFILATSYQQIDYLKKRYKDKRFIFQKKEENGERLLNIHKNKKNSILVGTNMFWEGVDLPGDLLEIIIILKMPFAVPDDPIIKKRCQVMESNGIDPFKEYALPQAIIKLKQGMGRLIRKNDDNGIIYILDERIITKLYGKKVVNSFYVKPEIVDYETFANGAD